MIYDLQRKIIHDDDVLFKDEGLCGWEEDVDVIVDVDVTGRSTWMWMWM